jgi:hypothetical protein
MIVRKTFYVLQIIILLIMCGSKLFANGNVNLHAEWDFILKKYVLEGKVNYNKIISTPADLKRLNDYLTTLGTAEVSLLTRDERLAFWINAYNAFTVKLILNHYPLKSIKDIKNPWKQKLWYAGGEKLSLDDIEHIKLRKEFREPRIHFAIVCASIGCPELYPEAFEKDKIEQMLNLITRNFFAEHRNFQLKASGKMTTIYLNRIFKWFKNDFGKDDKQMVEFIFPYVQKQDRDLIKVSDDVTIKYLNYDWSLNDR